MTKYILITAQLLLLSSFTFAQRPATSGVPAPPPLVRYTFDETAGELAHNTGTGGAKLDARASGPVNWSNGLIGGAAILSNHGHFSLPPGVLENVTDFSLSVWVYIHEQATNQTVCTFANGTGQYLILTTQRGERENGVSLVMTKPQSAGQNSEKEERISYVDQKEKLSVNAWHHLAFTLNRNIGTLFVDGIKAAVKKDFTTNPAKLGHTPDNYIGKPTWPDPYLDGMLDDFRIYDYALADRDVYKLAAVADAQLVLADCKTLSLGDLSDLTANLALPANGKSGTVISWISAQPRVLDNNGKVYRPDAGKGNQKLKLTAKVSKGSATASKTFEVLVKDMATLPQDLDVFAMKTGNPTVPAYLADASFYYDENTATFFAYGTNDGAGGGNVYPTQVWYSKDCKNWKNKIVDLPKSWTDAAGTKAVWAPSIAFNPVTKKYYLMYAIDSKTFVAMADRPLGPWVDANAVAPGKMFFRGYDAQFFVDDDHKMYISTDAGKFKIIKLKFEPSGKISVDNDDPRFAKTFTNAEIGTYRYAQIEEIKNSFEASYIFKRNALYYLMWSFEGSENYNVRYAVSENITGPYREVNGSMSQPILKRDDLNHILGPGHHSMFNFKGRTFMAYHRQHHPFVDSKRQTCINEVFFNQDGSIRPVKPTHKGVTVVEGKPTDVKNLALGKQTMVSAARDYDNSHDAKRFRTYDISFRYSGNFAVDENYGTHWDAGPGSHQPWLIVDLNEDCRLDSIETIFEFTSRTYKYKLEYLEQRDAESLAKASSSKSWKTFADKSASGAAQSPVTDVPARAGIKGRFVRLTVLDAVNLPPTADDLDPENAQNGLSIFELKVFGSGKSSVLNQVMEAELFSNQYGLQLEKKSGEGLQVANWDNNDYLLLENLDFGEGATGFEASVLNGFDGASLEIRIDDLRNKPAGILKLSDTGGNKIKWKTAALNFDRPIKGLHHKIYLVFKSGERKGNNLKLDWYRFTKGNSN